MPIQYLRGLDPIQTAIKSLFKTRHFKIQTTNEILYKSSIFICYVFSRIQKLPTSSQQETILFGLNITSKFIYSKVFFFQGLPFPILTVGEYFSVDAEGFCWGRNYRQAGYYTSIFLWSVPLVFLSQTISRKTQNVLT